VHFSLQLTGHFYWSPLLVDKPSETKKFNDGPSLIDEEITATRDLVTESDALVRKTWRGRLTLKVTTEIAKKHYTFLKSIGPRRLDMVRSSCDNVVLAVKRLSHPLEDVRQQRENFRLVRLMKYVCTLTVRLSSYIGQRAPKLSIVRPVHHVRFCYLETSNRVRFKNELWVAMECLMGGTLQEAKSHFQFHEKHIKYM
jgi:hypothetical protein